MDRRHSRNMFAVAMFCLFNASIVSAQTATNLKCSWCVDPGELSWNAVSWWTLDPSLRQGLTAQQDTLDALNGRLDALETAPQAELKAVVDSTDRVVGEVIGYSRNFLGFSGNTAIVLRDVDGVTFVVSIVNEPGATNPDRLWHLLGSQQASVWFTGANCTGTAYLLNRVGASFNDTSNTAILEDQHTSTVRFFIDTGAPLNNSSVPVLSRIALTRCEEGSATLNSNEVPMTELTPIPSFTPPFTIK